MFAGYYLDILAAALAEGAEALLDPWLSSGSQLLQPLSPEKKNSSPDSKTNFEELKKKFEIV